jgi:hypothetical protein
VRVGLRYVRGLSDALLERIDAERPVQTFVGLEDFTRRTCGAGRCARVARDCGRVRVFRRHASRRVVGRRRLA